MGLCRRLDLCHAYYSGNRDFDCSFTDLFRKLFRPTCTMLAKRHIVRIVDDGAFKLIYFLAIKHPLYWPKDIPIYNLYMVISESLYEADWHYYEVPETSVLPGEVVLDCGAAEGLFSLKNMGKAHCIVIEPAPLFVAALERTFAGQEQVKIIPQALGSRPGEAYLSRGRLDSTLAQASPESPDGAVKVPVTTIDRLVAELGLPKVDYLKADLESFELEALQGAAQTIRAFRPKIALTTYHPGNDWQEIRDYCLALCPGYHWRVKGLSFATGSPQPVMIHLWPA